MRTLKLLISTILLLALAACQMDSGPKTVLLPVKTDPTISFRILFHVGSQNDPAGKEGLSAMTAELLTAGATEQHSYEEILALLYPMAASIENQVDKEMTVFSGRTHRDNLDKYYELMKEVLLTPAFNENDFQRVKTDFLNNLEKSLRYSQDEELGKEVLYNFIFQGTPYSHYEEGSVAGIQAITLDDVRQFYTQHYTQANLVIGVGGGYQPSLIETIRSDFSALPAGTASTVVAPQPQAIDGIAVRIIEKDAQSTAISFGFPIDVQRGSRDFYALALATSWLGEHRNSSSHLYQVIREARGLNYGDYAYIEHFPLGGFRQFPPPNVARRQQIFQVWIRPVPTEARVFSFRAALRELQMLVDNGMSESDFELTRTFLKNYTPHYAPTTMTRLGYALDDAFYGIEAGHWKKFRTMLDDMKLEEVNAALKKHFQYSDLKAVFITSDGGGLRDMLVNNTPSPITYGSPKPAEIIEEDKIIAAWPLQISAAHVEIVPVDSVFAR